MNLSRVEVEYLCGCKEFMQCNKGRETETVDLCIKVLCRSHNWTTPTPHLLIVTRASSKEQEQYKEDLQAAQVAFKKPVNEGAALVGGEILSHCRKCKKDGTHVIHAVVDDQAARVECMTCHSTHKFFVPTGKV